MNAIRLLEQQHDQVADLLTEFQESDDDDFKVTIFEKIADSLAIHAGIEERHFYPAVRARATEDELAEAYDEHLEIKRLVLDCMASTGEPGFDGKVAALGGVVQHHVEEEENELFPKVKKLLDADALEAIGQQMEAESAVLEERGNARFSIDLRAEEPAIQP